MFNLLLRTICMLGLKHTMKNWKLSSIVNVASVYPRGVLT